MQLLGEFRFTSIPVRTIDGRMDKLIDIYDISKPFRTHHILIFLTQSSIQVAYLLTRALQASKEDLLSKMGDIMINHTVQDVLNSMHRC